MKNKKKKLTVGLMIAVLFIVFFTAGRIGNSIGSFLHYGNCPNCGDSWLWKTSGSIEIGEIKDLSSEFGSPSVPFIEIQHGIMICEECLMNPAGLDEARIEQDLLNYEWSPEKAAQTKEAVVRYKEKKLQN